MNRTISIATFLLTELFVSAVITSTLGAAIPEPAKAAAVDTAPAPKIQFETNFYDFGKITAAESLSGVFKFKKAGDGILKGEPPVPSCDCTSSKVKPDTLAPGANGQIEFPI